MCACALTAYIPNSFKNTATEHLDENIWFKDFFVLFVAECLFGVWEIAVHLAVVGDVYNDVILC